MIESMTTVKYSTRLVDQVGDEEPISAHRFKSEDVADICSVLVRGLDRGFAELGLPMPPYSLSIEPLKITGDGPVLDQKSPLLFAHALEKCGDPIDYADAINDRFEVVACATAFMRDRLIDAGVVAKVVAIGSGIDHLESIEIDPSYESRGRAFKYVLVHDNWVGTKLALESFSRVFDASDPVSLLIRPTNKSGGKLLSDKVSSFTERLREAPDIIVLDCLEEGAWKALLRESHVFISTTNSGQFDTCLAQAMLMGVPAIAPARGGHLEYCSPENAWLIGAGPSGMPTANLLEAAIWEVYKVGAEERFEKGWAGRTSLLETFTWKSVALRLYRLLNEKKVKTKAGRVPRIGFVTTWNVRCGIGVYVEHMLSNYPLQDYTIFAAHQEPRTRPDKWNVCRSWQISKDDNDFSMVKSEIEMGGIDAVVIQFNYGFYNHAELSDLIDYSDRRNVPVVLDLHSTIDPYGNVPNFRLEDLIDSLRRCSRVLVHSDHDFDRMYRIGLRNNVTRFPLGSLSRSSAEDKRRVGREPLLVSFGFCFESKGLIELVRAVDILRNRGQRVKLCMLNAEYPNQPSHDYVKAIKAEITALNLENVVEFISEYVEDDICLDKIAAADLFVNPYQYTNESASAATRYGLAAVTPVLVTPLPIFSEYGEAVFRAPGTTPGAFADGIQRTLQHLRDESGAAKVVKDAADIWRVEHDYGLIGAKLMRTVRAYV